MKLTRCTDESSEDSESSYFSDSDVEMDKEEYNYSLNYEKMYVNCRAIKHDTFSCMELKIDL